MDSVAENLKPRGLRARVVNNRRVARDVYRLTLEGLGPVAAAARPGQFVMIKVTPGVDPLLPRPFSIHMTDQENGTITILYKVVGRGTRLLSGLGTGDTVHTWGPLGHGFDFIGKKAHVLVGGGMGVAPLAMLMDRLAGERSGEKRLLIAAAARADDLMDQGSGRGVLDTFDAGQGQIVKNSERREDGDLGFRHGLATDVLGEILAGPGWTDPAVYACGPTAMLRACYKICSERGLPLQVSIESRMACGLGACLGCVVPAAPMAGGQYLRVCAEGPVFDAGAVDWDRLPP